MYKIGILFQDREFEHDIYELIRAFYPGSEICSFYEEEEAGCDLYFRIEKQGDFFVESPIILLAAIIWYLKIFKACSQRAVFLEKRGVQNKRMLFVLQILATKSCGETAGAGHTEIMGDALLKKFTYLS